MRLRTLEPLVPEPSAFEFELAIEKLKNYKSRGIDQIPAELIKAGCRTIFFEIHKLIISIWNKEELPDEWKGSIIVPIYKKGIKQIVITIGAYHYCLLRTVLSNILLSRLIPYVEEGIRDHQCGFRRNRSTNDHIFCICQILKKKWEYNEAVHQLCIDFKEGL